MKSNLKESMRSVISEMVIKEEKHHKEMINSLLDLYDMASSLKLTTESTIKINKDIEHMISSLKTTLHK